MLYALSRISKQKTFPSPIVTYIIFNHTKPERLHESRFHGGFYPWPERPRQGTQCLL